MSTNHINFGLVALTAAATLGSSVLGSIIDNPNGFVLRSSGSIAIQGNVLADAGVGALGNVTVGWGSFVDGPTESGATRTWLTPAIDPWSTPGGSNISLDWSQTRSLTAGSYGALTSNSSTTLNLGPGSYTFSSFQLGWAGQVNADTTSGDVYVYVNGALSAGDATRFQATGPGTLYLISGGNSSFGYQANIEAAVYSRGTLNFGGEARLDGLAYADGNISAGYGSRFSFLTIPAPGALALIPAIAGMALRGRRRRI
jgi:hypothetical protein